MTILALDSSSRRRLLCAVARDDGTLVSGEQIVDGTVSEHLVPAVTGMLRSDISAVVVVTGPGSFTGLRAGMAVGLGIAHARDLPLYGAEVFAVIAAAWPELRSVEALADAGRGFLYSAVVARSDGGTTVTDHAEHRHRDAWSPRDGLPAVTFDDLTIAGILRAHDPLPALASVGGQAVLGTPVARSGLSPTYLGESPSAPEPRVS